jgi:hypothetical protein
VGITWEKDFEFLWKNEFLYYEKLCDYWGVLVQKSTNYLGVLKIKLHWLFRVSDLLTRALKMLQSSLFAWCLA